MLRRSKKAPTLYELIRERPTGGPFSPGAGPVVRHPIRPATQAEDDRPAGGGSLFSPGRVVRVPVGYLFFAAAAVLALIVAGYALGYKKRDAEAAAERQREAQRALDGVTDPLQTAQEPTQGVVPAEGRTAAMPERTAPAVPLRTGPGGRVVRIDAPGADPRQPGLNYLVIAFLPEKEAQRAAEFLAGQGLEIGLVKADNRPSWREIVDLQGLEASQLGGDASDRIRQRVTALGREYKRQERGPVDFADAYWKKHQTR